MGRCKKGAEAAAQELDIQVLVRGPADEVDVKAQAVIINSMVEAGCNALVLAPNAKSRKFDVANLKSQGINTVFIDRDIGGKRIAVIKTDNFQAGYVAGTEMAKALSESSQKRIALMRMDKDVVSTSLREQGFIKAANEFGLTLQYEGFIGTTIHEARVKSYKALSNLGEFEGVFTPNESTSVSVLASLKQLGLEQKVKHIGFDSHDLMVKSVKSKNMYGFLIQDPYLMGYQGVKTAYADLHGMTYETDISADVTFVSRKNITHKRIQSLLGFIQ